MAKAFLIHGSYGNPNNNWFPWLRKKLTELHYEVITPKFPTPKGQNLKNWLKTFAPYINDFDKDTIVIGHSLGVPFLLNILEMIDQPIKAAFLVAGFTGLLNNKMFDHIVHTFSDKTFDFKKIKRKCKKFFIFHSDNDPYVPFEKSEELAKNLDCEITLILKGGHFSLGPKWKKFEALLQTIKSA